jgi:hypothetical protein
MSNKRLVAELSRRSAAAVPWEYSLMESSQLFCCVDTTTLVARILRVGVRDGVRANMG